MVYFVGAGPGAVDLITLRGYELIKRADVIIYAGSLVNDKLLENCKSKCLIYNSAKMTLEEVIDAILDAELENKMTVRLHTGDPSIYGAIREQMDLLDKHSVKYEVVPGVSSFCAAAAAINAEYTLPSVSQTIIITRASGRTPVPERESIKLLSQHGASMAIFLSAGLLHDVQNQLLDGGYSPSTPVAIIYKASWDDQKIIYTSVENLEVDAKKNSITKTALILVGNFLGSKYDRSMLYDPNFSHEFRKSTNES